MARRRPVRRPSRAGQRRLDRASVDRPEVGPDRLDSGYEVSLESSGYLTSWAATGGTGSRSAEVPCAVPIGPLGRARRQAERGEVAGGPSVDGKLVADLRGRRPPVRAVGLVGIEESGGGPASFRNFRVDAGGTRRRRSIAFELARGRLRRRTMASAGCGPRSRDLRSASRPSGPRKARPSESSRSRLDRPVYRTSKPARDLVPGGRGRRSGSRIGG